MPPYEEAMLEAKLCGEEEKYISLEEAYYNDFTHSGRRTGGGAAKRKEDLCSCRNRKISSHKRDKLLKIQKNQIPNKKNQSRSRPKLSLNRREARKEKQITQLEARKENIQHRIQAQQSLIEEEFQYEESSFYNEDYLYSSHEILDAKNLGIDDGPMYERLLNILQGCAITPEDYDLLLQLDRNNVKPTLDENTIEKFPVMVIGEASEGNFPIEDIGIDHCEICLEPWSSNAEIRRLPCQHIFCKHCIDYWLKEVSQKCPNLSCYWCKDID